MGNEQGGIGNAEHAGFFNEDAVADRRAFDSLLDSLVSHVAGASPGVSRVLGGSMFVQVVAGGASVSVAEGAAFLGDDGVKLYRLTAALVVAIPNAGAGLGRIDRIGLRLDARVAERSVGVVRIAGVEAANPVVPDLPDTQDNERYFLELAQVTRTASDALTADDVSDTRTFAASAGFVGSSAVGIPRDRLIAFESNASNLILIDRSVYTEIASLPAGLMLASGAFWDAARGIAVALDSDGQWWNIDPDDPVNGTERAALEAGAIGTIRACMITTEGLVLAVGGARNLYSIELSALAAPMLLGAIGGGVDVIVGICEHNAEVLAVSAIGNLYLVNADDPSSSTFIAKISSSGSSVHVNGSIESYRGELVLIDNGIGGRYWVIDRDDPANSNQTRIGPAGVRNIQAIVAVV